MNDQLWSAREALIYSPSAASAAQGGTFVLSGKSYTWSQEIRALSGLKFYTIHLSVNWDEGNRPLSLAKETYAFRKELSV